MSAGTNTWLRLVPTVSVPAQPKATTTKMDTTTGKITYNPATLKTIGQQCSGSLPPASAVQAMFMYELKRQSEEEKLFHNQMFRLARNEDTATLQQKRIDALEAKVTKLETTDREQELEERLATSKSTQHMLCEKVSGCVKRLEVLESGMAALQGKVDGALEQQQREQEQEQEKESERKDSVVGGVGEQMVETMKQEIDVLFDDRDGILRMIKDIQDKMVIIEDSLSYLTTRAPTDGNVPLRPTTPPGQIQRNHPPSSPVADASTNDNAMAPTSTSTPDQRISIPLRGTSENHPPAELSVPRGQPHVGLRGSVHAPPPVPTPTSSPRSFSPGKPWAS